MITDFYTTLFVITRGVWATDGEGNRYSTETEVGQFNGHIQQAQAQLLESLGLTLTKAYSVWCPIDTDIIDGDIIQSVDGYYSVKAVQTFNLGGNKHIQAIVQFDQVVGS